MHYANCFFVITILFGTVTGNPDEWGLVHFNKSLMECFMNNRDFVDILNHHKLPQDLAVIFELLMRVGIHFEGKSITEDVIFNTVTGMYNAYYRGKTSNSVPPYPMDEIIKTLLLECAVEIIDGGQFIRPPRILQERPFQYSECQWCPGYFWEPLLPWRGMGFFTSSFDGACRNRRAALFFDSRELAESYISHQYSSDHPYPHVVSNPTVFNTRWRKNFFSRHPKVSYIQFVGIELISFLTGTQIMGCCHQSTILNITWANSLE